VKLRIHPRAPETLADQLFEAVVEFPCGGESACGGCKVRVLEGEVPVTLAMRDALSEQEIRDGWRLACCALSAGSVVVEVEQWSLAVLTDEAREAPLVPIEPRAGRGAVIDLGTTTLVVQVVDLGSGEVVRVETALVHAAEAAVGADQAELDAARRRVHQAAAADPARRAAADHVAVEPAIAHVHAIDGARARPHPRANAPAFKRRAGRRRRTNNPLRRSHRHLAVGADVEERARPRLLVQARGHDAAEQVAADESAQAGQELGRPGPRQLPIREAVAVQRGRDERRVRQRLHIEAAEEMVHRRIARQQHLAEPLAAQHPPERLADGAAQFAGVAQVVLQPAHYVRSAARLRVELAGERHHLGEQVLEIGVSGELDMARQSEWMSQPRAAQAATPVATFPLTSGSHYGNLDT
jgi:ferredoxin